MTMTEPVDRRILGAVRFLDADTLSRVSDGLNVKSDQGDLRKNRSGLWVIWQAAGLEAHTRQFAAPPAAPALESVSVTLSVADTAMRYMSRSATIRLPRDPDPASAGPAGSLFQTIDLKLYRAPSASVSPLWAVIRGSITNSATGKPLGGALLRVLRTSDNVVLARGMSDTRGEALVALAGIPITTFNSGAGTPLATEIDVTIEAIFDPAAGAVADPDSIEGRAGLPNISVAKKLAAGRELILPLAVSVP